MLLLAPGDDLTRRHVERGKQIKRAVANVIVGLALGLAEVHRQDRLCTLERLNLRFLVEGKVEGKCDRVARRVHVQPHDVTHLCDELRIRRHLVRAADVRLEPDAFGVVSRVLTMSASTCSSAIVRGPPTRGSSYKPSSRRAMKRSRHFPTVCPVVRARLATSALETAPDSAHARISRARTPGHASRATVS